MSHPSSVPASGFPIETARALAILFLVSFHVIGGEPGFGLKVHYPHPLRYYADILVDLRMPLFAFVAGAVYAQRPVRPAALLRFQVGKLRRLAIPGAVAITLFAVFATLLQTEFAPEGPLLGIYYRNYAIFWFLQAVLLINLVYCSLDVLTGGRILLPALVLSLAALGLGLAIPSTVLSANRVLHLLPYYLLGVAVMRHAEWILANRTAVLCAALALIAAGTAANLLTLQQTGALSAVRGDAQSVMFATGACVAAILLLPTLPVLSSLGAFGFTIYLYHIFGTSLARRLLWAGGVDDPWLDTVAGTVAGIGAGLAVHALAARLPSTRRLILGLKD